MATLYINRNDIELTLDGQTLRIEQNSALKNRVPLKLIERLIIQHNIKLDTGLLLKLAENNATVLLLSPRHSRRVALILGPAHNQAAIRLAQACQVSAPQQCQPMAQQLVISKIKRQQRLLESALTQRGDARKPLFDGISHLQAILDRLAQTTPDHSALRGHEGAAARAYFQAYAALMPPELEFTGRNRRPPRDPINAGLSLAYTLLHSDAVRAAHMAGLDPMLGVYHRPAFGRESLASDLIEPLRPQADAWLWEQIRNRNLRVEHFSQDGQACLLGKAGRDNFFTAWEQHAKQHRRWLRIQSSALAKQWLAQGTPLLAATDNAEE